MTVARASLLSIVGCAAIVLLAGPAGRLAVVLPLLLFAPGYLAAQALRLDPPAGLCIRPALWLGLSLSIVALFYQWATAAGLALSAPVLAALAAACVPGVAWSVWRRAAPGDLRPAAAIGAWGILLAILALTLWLRFQQIASLALPSWVDSVHHALMIRVAAERGGVPYSLRPYLPVDHLPYHWGYHVFTAAVMQLSGVTLPQVMLWEGQVLNALHVVTCAALAAYWWRRPAAGVVAGLIAGLISIMPAYYVSWGRYTQLTGLLLLPPLAIAWSIGLRAPALKWSVCVALLVAGLSVIHVRVLIFALCLMAAIGVVWAVPRQGAQLRSRLRHALLSAGLAGVLMLPWLSLLVTRQVLRAVENPGSLVSTASYSALSSGLLWAGQNRLLVALALVVALWGLARRRQAVMVQTVWMGGLFVLANPWLVSYLLPATGVPIALWGTQQRRWLVAASGAALLLINPRLVRIPSSWLIPNDVIAISLFIPLAVLIGGGACGLLAWLEGRLAAATLPEGIGRQRLVVRGVGIVALIAAATWGARDLQGPQSGVLNSSTILGTQADVAAIEWAAQHTPPDARFLINATPWLRGTDRGVDGGFWLLPLAGRWTSTLPALYIYSPPEYVRQVQSLSRQVINFKPGQEQLLYQRIDQEGITHIYLGRNAGPLSLAVFADSQRFEKLYDADGITILAVHQQP